MPDRKYTRWMRIRLLTVVGLLGLLAVVVLVRIWTLQVSQADWLRGLAEDQYLKLITLEPIRGAIVDRNGAAMAASVMTDSVFVMPTELTDTERTARSPLFAERENWPETMIASRALYHAWRGEQNVTCGPWYVTAPQKVKTFETVCFPEKGVDLAARDNADKPLWQERPEYREVRFS